MRSLRNVETSSRAQVYSQEGLSLKRTYGMRMMSLKAETSSKALA
jgi:hypothetical protein